jgi:hypothetical protein
VTGTIATGRANERFKTLCGTAFVPWPAKGPCILGRQRVRWQIHLANREPAQARMFDLCLAACNCAGYLRCRAATMRFAAMQFHATPEAFGDRLAIAIQDHLDS